MLRSLTIGLRSCMVLQMAARQGLTLESSWHFKFQLLRVQRAARQTMLEMVREQETVCESRTGAKQAGLGGCVCHASSDSVFLSFVA